MCHAGRFDEYHENEMGGLVTFQTNCLKYYWAQGQVCGNGV